MSGPISSPPMPLKCSSYADCTKQSHYKPSLKRKLYKNTTNLHTIGACSADTLDATTGVTNVIPLYAGYFSDIYGHNCGYNCGMMGAVRYDGTNYPAGYIGGSPQLCGPWNPRPPVQSSAAMDALLGVTVIGGGTGYTDGDLLTVTYSVVGTGDVAPTFRVKVTGGVIQSATVVKPGAIYTNLTAITTASGGTGTGASFGFTRQDAIFDYSSCSMNGWASVASFRQWHGFRAFNNPEGAATIQCDPTDTSMYPAGSQWAAGVYTYGYEPARLSPPTDKYTTLDISCNYTGSFVGGAINQTYGVPGTPVIDKRNITVNPQSGEVVFNTGSDMNAIPSYSPAYLTQPTSLLNKCFGGLGAGGSFVGFSSGIIGIYNYNPSNFTLTALAGCVSGTSHVGYKIEQISPYFLYEKWEANFASGVFHRETHYNPGGGSSFNDTWEDLAVTATGFSYEIKTSATDGTYTSLTDATAVGTLSALNTSAAVVADADAIMAVENGGWNLLDRVQLPLQTVSWGYQIPKVSRNENQSFNWLTTPWGSNYYPPLTMPDYTSWNSGTSSWNTTGWKDMSCWTWYIVDSGNHLYKNIGYFDSTHLAAGIDRTVDGSVLGLPIDSSGPIPLSCFDWRNNDWQICYASWATDGYISRYGYWIKNYTGGTCATQATNLYEMSQVSVGRARTYGSQFNPNTGLVVTKSVYSSVRFPSYNHARPFGLDRWLVDETQANIGCFVSGTVTSTGGTLASSPSGLATTQQWSVYGTSANGVYQIDSITGPVLTWHSVGTLPPGFTYWDNGAGSGRLGIMFKLRMPSCPPFGGRLAVTTVTDNHDGTVTLVTEATPVKIDDAVPSGQVFTVDLCDTNMTALASNLTATTSSVTTFKVTTTYATVAAAKWVTLYGALDGEVTVNWSMPDASTHAIPKWYWNYTVGKGVKGVMVQGEWTRDFRTNDESSRIAAVIAAGEALSPVPACVASIPTVTPNLGYNVANTNFEDTCKGSHSCGPWLIVFSGSATDTPPTGQGVRYDFTYSLPLDERYSSQQSIDCYQAMVDPLHQTPHASCGSSTAPTCLPLVEARAILPGSAGGTAPPDGGGGPSLTSVPPTPIINYTLLNPATNSSGNLALPPNPTNQPDVVYATSGIFTPC